MKTFNFIDLFAGIGGFRLALDALGGNCVFTSEIDERAKETYVNNHGGEVFGDIRNITAPKYLDAFVDIMIPNHDVLAAGFPCQPFSLAMVFLMRHKERYFMISQESLR
jgi:DNA (cytosine-5)-methyltransferase 1